MKSQAKAMVSRPSQAITSLMMSSPWMYASLGCEVSLGVFRICFLMSSVASGRFEAQLDVMGTVVLDHGAW
jgi:hypothetical protein